MSSDRLETLKGERVLLTGGAGLIGRHVKAQLDALGAHVIVLDNLSACDPELLSLCGVDMSGHSFNIGSVSDRELTQRLVAGCNYVIHGAAHSTVAGCRNDPDTAFSSNIHGTENVIRAVSEANSVRRFIFISSAQVYGHGAGDTGAEQIFREESAMLPLNLYASAKLWGEHQTRFLLDDAGIDYSILRPFSVYGAGQIPQPKAFNWAIAQLSMYGAIGDPLPLNHGGRQIRDFVHVDDAARGIVRSLIAAGASRQTLNLGTGTATSIRQVADIVCSHFPAARIVNGTRTAQDPLGGRADITRMVSALGWSPGITVASGIAKYIQWLSDTPDVIPGWLKAEGPDRVESWKPSSGRDSE